MHKQCVPGSFSLLTHESLGMRLSFVVPLIYSSSKVKTGSHVFSFTRWSLGDHLDLLIGSYSEH